MNEDKRSGLYEWLQGNDNLNDFDIDEMPKRARNPYSWMNYMEKRSPRNPYSWMAYGEKRAPLNPYSWMYTLQKRVPVRYFRNPYSWQSSSASW
ncbi:hypothetical protein Tcan_08031 [Toxocara canis]|nr:hypothetical protein Tcan_08031 [Toxocara canis]